MHNIEPAVLDGLPGDKHRYSSWTEQIEGLRQLLSGARRVAMQYSPNCAVPYVSMVDAGTVELVRASGVEVVGSADLVQQFEARWTERNLESHLETGRKTTGSGPMHSASSAKTCAPASRSANFR